MENDFQIKWINAKESVTFQNEENERDMQQEQSWTYFRFSLTWQWP